MPDPALSLIVATAIFTALIAASVAAWLRSRNRLHNGEKTITELEVQLSHAQERISEKDAQILKQDQQLEAEKAATREQQQTVNDLKTQMRALEVGGEKAQERIDELAQTIRQREGERDSAVKNYQTLRADHARLQTSLEEKQRHFDQQLKLLNENKEQLKIEFQNLANEIFENKGKAFTETNRQSIDTLLSPFKKQIDEFKKQVQDIHHKDTQQQAQLRTELGQLKELNRQITEEAHELATALRGQKKVQGNWGELVLENVLERSGLIAGTDYQREVSINREDGGRARPDVIVYLPQSKHLVIDAKVSLNAYTRYINSEDEAERQLALRDHVEAFANRINELADRDYHQLPGLNSPEMVFMFVPIESAFVEALKADESLFLKAIERNVLVATPTTLLTSLNIVRQLWRYEDQNKHTAELARSAEGVFKKLNTFLASFQSVKTSLDKAQEAYGRAENQLLSGRGNLVKRVGEFKNLAPSIRAELPEYFVEKAELEVNLLPDSESESSREQEKEQQ